MDPSGWQLAVCGHTAWWLVASWCKPRMVPKTIHVVMSFFTLFYGVLVCFCPIIVIALRVSLLLVHCAHSWRVSSISILVLVTNGPRWVAFLPCRSQQVFFKRMQPMWFGSSKAIMLPIWIYFAWLHAQAFEVGAFLENVGLWFANVFF